MKVKEEATRHFEQLFMEPVHVRPNLLSTRFQRLQHVVTDALEVPFSMEELKSAVWSCGSDKAPGPDELNFKFV